MMTITGVGGSLSRANTEAVGEIKIPLPPLSIQQEIVAEIEGYQKIIDGAKAVVENYKPKIDINPEWEMVELGGLAKNLDGKRVPITKSVRDEGKYPYYGASGIVDYVADFIFDEDLLLISEDGANLLARVTPIAFSVSGKVWVNNHAHVLRFDERATQKFVELYLNSISLEPYITGSAQPKLNQKALNSIPIPFPDLKVQKQIVSRIEMEQGLVSANQQLIEIFEQKIKDRIAKVWGAS
jgi:restriction endonuclease S subunit